MRAEEKRTEGEGMLSGMITDRGDRSFGRELDELLDDRELVIKRRVDNCGGGGVGEGLQLRQRGGRRREQPLTVLIQRRSE